MICLSAIFSSAVFFQTAAPADPAGVLKWSLDKYKGLTSYRANVKMATTSGAGGQGSETSASFKLKLPDHVKLVDTSKPVTFGAEVPQAGAETIHQVKSAVKVTGGGEARVTKVDTIGVGEQTGQIYSLDEVQRMLLPKEVQDQQLKRLEKMPSGKEKEAQMNSVKNGIQSESRAEFSEVELNPSLTAKDFDTTLPRGVYLAPAQPALQEGDSPKPPVPIGHIAPNFSVVRMDGTRTRLSSLRGHVVMLDFWATWCGPCKESLPETYRLSRVGAPKGLRVMPISDEDRSTVAAFLKENHYDRPTFLDKGDAAEKVYHIEAIPTVVIIDARGKLSAYMVGEQDPNDLKAALKKAGASL